MSQQTPAPNTIVIDPEQIRRVALSILKWSLWVILWIDLGYAEYTIFGTITKLLGGHWLVFYTELVIFLGVSVVVGISLRGKMSLWRAMVWIIGSINALVIIDSTIKSLNSAFGTNRMLIVCEWIAFVVFPLTVFWLARRKVAPLGKQLSESDLETLSSIKWHLGTGNTLYEKLRDVNNAIELMKKEKYIP